MTQAMQIARFDERKALLDNACVTELYVPCNLLDACDGAAKPYPGLDVIWYTYACIAGCIAHSLHHRAVNSLSLPALST